MNKGHIFSPKELIVELLGSMSGSEPEASLMDDFGADTWISSSC